MIRRELLRIPDRELVSHGLLRDLVFRQGLNDFIVDQQPVNKQDLLAGCIGRLENNRAPLLAVLHADENRGLHQFCLVFQFLHDDLGYSRIMKNETRPTVSNG